MPPQFSGLLPDRSRAALLVLDMISTFQFPDGRRLQRTATRIAPRIAALKERCKRAGIACIYANDDVGRWRSDSRQLIEDCRKPGSAGAEIVDRLQPEESDYLILKPRHSAFFATPLDVLLNHLGTRRLILTGASSHQCVLFTANDAHQRGLDVIVASDCVAGPSIRDTRFALQYFARVLGARVCASRRIRLGPLTRPAGR